MTNRDIILEELELLRKEIISNMQKAGQMATGKTANMFEVKNVSETHGEMWGAMWTFALEKGSGPTRKKGTASLQDMIKSWEAWIIAKGIQVKDEKDLNRLAKFFIWYKSKYGTKLYRNNGRSDIFTPAVESFSKRLVDRIGSLYVKQILNTI